MSVNAALVDFVKLGLERGIPKQQLDEALRQAGWDREQVGGAMRQFADVEFAIPVPRPVAYTSAREAFMYLVMFLTLYLSAYHLGSLGFELIDQAFPDGAAQRYAELYAISSIRWSSASLVVMFPVFLYVARLINAELRADVTRRASKVRRQLTYLTLFIAAAILIGDLTTLLYNLLGGELAIRFVLKVVTAGVIAGTGFVYYLRELRHDEQALSS
jgi:hypothetical protein